MGKQNDAFTAYLGRAEVLADLYNGCLYQGEEVVRAGNLCEVQQFYQQGLSERVKRPTARRRERDAIRAFWNEKSYVLLAAEAQNQPHLTMPFRCMEYDLAEYARQLRYIRLKREGKLKTGVEYLNRISRMDVATYDMICVMLNLKELQDKKEKYLKNGKGNYILSMNDMFLTQPFGLNIGTLFPGPLAFRWTFQFYDQSQTSAELADLLERVSPYFLNGVQVFGVIIVEAIVFLALIAFVYQRQEI